MVPLMLLAATLGPVPRVDAVDEFATRPTPKPAVGQAQRARIPEILVLRVPDLVAQPLGTARAILETRNLRVGLVQARPTTDHRPGLVLAQDPKPGTAVDPGSPVNIWIAAQAAPTDGGRLPADRSRQSGLESAPRVPPPTPRVVRVPDLIRQPASRVAALLDRASLEPGAQRREESEAPADTVTSQTPAPGSLVRPGTRVNVVIAVPASIVVVPDVTERAVEQARERLARERLAAGRQRAEPSAMRADTVLAQSPAAGTRVPPGTRVDLVVATPNEIAVPDVTGLWPQHARDVLARRRLELGEQGREQSTARAGTVVSQSPAAGTRARPGTAVRVVVAVPIPAPAPVPVAPPAEPPPAAPMPTPPSATKPSVEPPARPAVQRPKPAPERPAPSPPLTPVEAATPAPAVELAGQPAAPAVQPGTPVVQAAPPRQNPRWPRLAWALASALVLAAGAGYYRHATHRIQLRPAPAPPVLRFASHWDAGAQQIGPVGPLALGAALRLRPGLESASVSLDDEHLVGARHDTGGTER